MGEALITDLYQLTMAQAYHANCMSGEAVFELSVRRLPPARRFLVAAGLEQALEYLEGLRFEEQELRYLASLGVLRTAFLEHLAGVRFTGTVHAMPEGTPFFADEPILRVTAPILEAQLVESRLLNLVHFQTLVASKAVRCALAAGGRRLIDFGLRRAHGAEAGILAARAALIGGFDATATVEAGRRFGMALSGTMAHSYIEAHEHETSAFLSFLDASPEPTALLIDTYDTERAAGRIGALLQQPGKVAQARADRLHGVRIDSGDLGAQAQAVRRILDAHGGSAVQIVLSGGLDEHLLEQLVQARAPVDAFGVGTHLVVSEDAPSLDMAYKLVEYDGRPRRKRSPGKQTWPGAKQVWRERATGHTEPTKGTGGVAGEHILRDCIALAEEAGSGEPLLRKVMSGGRRLAPGPLLGDLRAYCRRQVAALPAALRRLEPGAADFPVRLSRALQSLGAALDQSDARETG